MKLESSASNDDTGKDSSVCAKQTLPSALCPGGPTASVRSASHGQQEGPGSHTSAGAATGGISNVAYSQDREGGMSPDQESKVSVPSTYGDTVSTSIPDQDVSNGGYKP